jgi:predicted dienelactone hydrolase
VQRPDAPPFAARGSLAVGVRTLSLEDPNRARSVQVEVWYPTKQPSQPGFYEAMLGKTPVKIPGVFARDAELLGSFPLVVVSHGQPGTRFQLAYLAEHLASRGFVVASLEHPGSTYQSLTQENYITSLVDRPLDVLLAMEHIPKEFNTLEIGLMGYSYGGYSVINAAGAGLDAEALAEYCTAQDEGPCFALPYVDQLVARSGIVADPRVKALVALAPYGYPWIGKRAMQHIQVPFLVAAGEEDDVATYQRDGLQYFAQAASKDKYLLTLERARHNAFVESPPEARASQEDYWRCWEPVWDIERSHDITKHFVAAFFEGFLYKRDQAKTYLDPELPGFEPRTKLGLRLNKA